MRILELQLTNFKRFTDLTIKGIPDSAKLVLLIGSNGCGKSSVFDAFNWLLPKFTPVSGGLYHKSTGSYFSKIPEVSPVVKIITADLTFSRSGEDVSSLKHVASMFYGRNSLRIIPKLQMPSHDISITVSDNLDKPSYSIDQDSRFVNDVHLHADLLNQAMQRLLVEGNIDQEATEEVRSKYISKINTALINIFGENDKKTLRFVLYKQPSPSKPVEPYFKKGDSEIPFELLSHGEKQVVIILFNFLVRQDLLQDKIIYIDEMDVHMNTKLQFDLIKEINENWIPDSSQLWTASHALGFIDYARQSEYAAIIDFDDLDFDQAQVLEPQPKESLDILEIAVPTEFLQKLLSDGRFVFCEGTDTAHYNSLNLKHTLFVSNKYNKFDVFTRSRDTNAQGIIDRDYLTDEEVDQFEKQFDFIRILRLYSIENYLYHPDNLAEIDGKAFDRQAYIYALTAEKNKVKEGLILGIQKAREGYPFNKELSGEQRKAFTENSGGVLKMLQSDDFETFYKVFPAKDYGKQIAQRANRKPSDLAKTKWFKQSITDLLKIG